jgi:hypothetical protein
MIHTSNPFVAGMRAVVPLVAALVAAASTGLALATPSAGAATPAAVAGTWSTGPLQVTGVAPVGNSLKLTGVAFSTWSGDLDGAAVADAVFLVRPNGSSVGIARETLTGSVAGIGSGTLTFVETASGAADGTVVIRATAVKGTGDLTGVRGHLVFRGTCAADGSGCAGTYSGRLR